MNDRLVPLTDDRCRLLIDEADAFEPNPGSVVITEGRHGTAWQLFFSDNRWHPTRGGGSKTWRELLTRSRVTLVYEAPERTQ